ncbi:MAG TPA: hypothetical protein VEK08_16000 [Planctomycetota bacterium]|nr:hypothetical protein [Planctomycetota bacterium]
MKFYLALDGTKDVTQAVRCKRGAAVGADCLVCVLPEGKDPDDLSGDELAAVKADARPVLTEWLAWLESLESEPDQRKRELEELRPYLQRWTAAAPALAGDYRNQVCAALALTAEEYNAWVKSGAKALSPNPSPKMGEGNRNGDGGDVAVMGEQPREGAERPEICNYGWVKRKVKETIVNADTGDEEEQTVEKNVLRALTVDEVQRCVHEKLNGEICALDMPGAKTPVLFSPTATGLKWIPTPGILKNFCGMRAILKFKTRADSTGQNYATWEDVHNAYALNDYVRRYRIVTMFPHEPPMKDTCYVWRPPADYPNPDGRYLAEVVKLFDNIVEPHFKALFAAAIVSPYWGGPCGERAAFAFIGDEPGVGKGKAAEAVGKPAGGLIETQMDEHAEKRLLEFLLHEKGLVKRVVRLDNMKDVIDSPLLESLITLPEITGHRLHSGLADRPNNLVVLITANGIRLSSDMARRIFFIKLQKPESYPIAWNDRYRQLIDENGPKIVADALAILKTPRPNVSFDGGQESFGKWVADVLARVVCYPALQAVLQGVTLQEVLRANDALRVDVDEAREQAAKFALGLFEQLVKENVVVYGNGGEFMQTPYETATTVTQPVFRSSEQMAKYWCEIFVKDKINPAWAGRKINEHIQARRIQFIERTKEKSVTRGFHVLPQFWEEHLAEQGFTQEERGRWRREIRLKTDSTDSIGQQGVET